MSELHEERSWACSEPDCGSFVMDEEYQLLGCATHGDTLKLVVRQFEDDQLVAEFREVAA